MCIMEILGVNIDFSDNKKLNQQFHSFAQQFSVWYDLGKTPKLASQDTRFTLELQKQKFQSLGLDVKVQVGKPAEHDSAPSSMSYSDNVFVNSSVAGNKRITPRPSAIHKGKFTTKPLIVSSVPSCNTQRKVLFRHLIRRFAARTAVRRPRLANSNLVANSAIRSS